MSESRPAGAPHGRQSERQRTGAISDAWYPHPDAYWVGAEEEPERPVRYGDLFSTPATGATGQPLLTPSGAMWHAVMALSPSCELVSKAKDEDPVEVARVLPLAAQDPTAAAAITAGWQEKGGRTTVAFAHTVFLAGVPNHPQRAEGMFAHLKQTVRVRLGDLRAAGRIAALDHDARVAVIRRELYYRYRWVVDMDDVRAMEADRIANDPHFTDPRPPWGGLR